MMPTEALQEAVKTMSAEREALNSEISLQRAALLTAENRFREVEVEIAACNAAIATLKKAKK